MAVSCVCKNDENRINLPTLDRGLFDGTMKAAIQKDRKRNKNNTSGATGVHFDSKRGLTMGGADYVSTQRLSLGQIQI